MITKSEVKKLDIINNVNKVYIVMDKHTILHTSENLLKSIYKKNNEDKISLQISIKNCDIPEGLKNAFKEKVEYNKKLA